MSLKRKITLHDRRTSAPPISHTLQIAPAAQSSLIPTSIVTSTAAAMQSDSSSDDRSSKRFRADSEICKSAAANYFTEFAPPPLPRFIYVPVSPAASPPLPHQHLDDSETNKNEAKRKDSEETGGADDKKKNGSVVRDENFNKERSSTGKSNQRFFDHRHLSRKALLPCIDSATIVARYPALYKNVNWIDNDPNGTPPEPSQTRTFILHYPGLANPSERFPCVQLSKSGHLEYDPILDLRQTAQLIVEKCIPASHSADYFGTPKKGHLRELIRACNRFRGSLTAPSVSSFEVGSDLIAAVDAMNGCIEKYKSDFSDFAEKSVKIGPPADFKLISHILEQAYARSVAPDSERLNNYKGFSNNVYGEVKHSLIDEFIRNAGIQSHHVFLDMGSGIGNAVLQIAGQCLCDSFGIEIMEIPSFLAQRQKQEFLTRMRYYAKPCGKIRLKKGDFLEDEEISEVLKRADVIFVNNYAFDADLNQRILHKFLDLKEHTKIISLKSFISAKKPITGRNINAIESILTVKEYFFPKDSVSWMNEAGKYYIHTVDRASLKSVLKK